MRFIREKCLANWAPASTAMPADSSDESDDEHGASKKKRGALLEDSDFSEEEEDSDQDLEPEKSVCSN